MIIESKGRGGSGHNCVSCAEIRTPKENGNKKRRNGEIGERKRVKGDGEA